MIVTQGTRNVFNFNVTGKYFVVNNHSILKQKKNKTNLCETIECSQSKVLSKLKEKMFLN